jgi:hypothetical protein
MKRKRPEESTLFNDIRDNVEQNDGVGLITPSSTPFGNLVSPRSLIETFLKHEQSGNEGTPMRPIPTLDTPPTQNQTPGIFGGIIDLKTPTIDNEQQLFRIGTVMFGNAGANTTAVPPFEAPAPNFDIPTPEIPPSMFQQPPIHQMQMSGHHHIPPPPPADTTLLPPPPQGIALKKISPSTPDSPSSDEDSMDEDNSSSASASSTATTFFRIAEGLNKASNVKYLGGKQNNQYPMPPQMLELDWNKLPRMYIEQYGLNSIHQLICRVYVLGFDRQRRAMVSLGRVSSDKRFHETPDGRWVAVFNDIFVQYASHNYGQRLALRFQLIITNSNDSDDGERVLCQVDSTEFQTITKRGLEKEQQRERNRIEKHKYGAIVEAVEPSIGFPIGNQLVKIYLSGMVGDSSSTSATNPQFLSQSQVTVYFGDQQSPEVHSVKKNIIICETPEHVPGEVDVVVSLVKKDNVGTCLTSKAKFRFVDPNDRDAPLLVLRHYATKSTHTVHEA